MPASDSDGAGRWPLALAVALLWPAAMAQVRPDYSTPMVDWSEAELRAEVPELAGLHPGATPGRLEQVLGGAAGRAAAGLRLLPALSAREDVHTLRFQPGGAFDGDERRQLRYDPQAPDNPLRLLEFLLPAQRRLLRLRYLGRAPWRGAESDVVVFFFDPPAASVGLAARQGLLWSHPESFRPLRLYVGPLPGANTESTTLVDYGSVRFSAAEEPVALPLQVIWTARSGLGETRIVRRFTDFHRLGEATAGTVEDAPPAPDSREALADGLTLLRAGKPADAVKPLREAVRQDADSAEANYQLGVALRQSGDRAGAVVALRRSIELKPEIPDSRLELGGVLFESADAAGAAEQFRAVLKRDGNRVEAHANLGEALARLGRREEAASEYRRAAELAPGEPRLRARMEQLLSPAAAPPAEPVIRVEVRQVLVPVVVSDAGGHTVAGLRQADFQVFEDGVEQTIASFSVERGVEMPAAAAPSRAAAAESPKVTVAAPAVSAQPRPVYIVVIDALHAESGSLVRMRAALQSQFAREAAGSAEYSLLALGSERVVLEAGTSDLTGILKALEPHAFSRLLTRSHAAAGRTALESFRRSVADVRRSCDSADPLERAKCEAGKRRILLQAEMVSEETRSTTITFLNQLRSVAEELAGRPGRKSLILLSDGFSLTPGASSFGLIAGQFPEQRSAAFRAGERMQGDFESIVRLATARNVVISTLDARGLLAPAEFDASTHGDAGARPAVLGSADSLARAAGDSLAELAAATGGLFIHDTNNLAQGLARVVADGWQSYVLAYVPRNDVRDGKFRSISVKLRDPRLRVRAKRGYWAAE